MPSASRRLIVISPVYSRSNSGGGNAKRSFGRLPFGAFFSCCGAGDGFNSQSDQRNGFSGAAVTEVTTSSAAAVSRVDFMLVIGTPPTCLDGKSRGDATTSPRGATACAQSQSKP